jgi:hypothetical protein
VFVIVESVESTEPVKPVESGIKVVQHFLL